MSTELPAGADALAPAAPAAPGAPSNTAVPAALGGAAAVAPGGQPATTPAENQGAPAPVTPRVDHLSIGDAPVVPVTPPAPTGEENKNTAVIPKVDDPGMNLAMDFVSKLGFGPDSNEIKLAVETGDFTLLEAKLASMGDKATGWKEHLQLAKAYLEAEDAKFEAHITECENVCFEVAGGQDNWAKIQAWAKQEADKNEKASLNKMLNGDKIQAKAAALYLTGLYQKAAGTVVEPQSALAGHQATTQTGQGSLSPEDFRVKLSDLVHRKGQFIDNDPEYKQLVQQRAAWRG